MGPPSSDNFPLGARQRRRLKVSLACEICRRRKVKYDGGRPACGNCSKRPALRGQCVYEPTKLERSNDSLSAKNPESGLGMDHTTSTSVIGHLQYISGTSMPPIALPDCLPCEQSPALLVTSTLSSSSTDRANSTSHEHFGSSSNIAFTGQIKAAIDARSDAAFQRQSPTTTPMVDISLFPSLQNDDLLGSVTDEVDYELPSRKQADYLLNAYWSWFDPLFPVLSRPKFMHAYGALFSGTNVDTDEPILVSTLNAMFTISIQAQDSLDSKQRERLSSSTLRI